ncbi:MAG: hypothetical protein ABJN51_16585, partial [Sneathiella sp.]
AVVLAGWTFNDYAASGEPIMSAPLTGSAGTLANIELRPSQAPARAFLIVDYEINVQDETNDAYTYMLSLKGPAGQDLLQATQTHAVKKQDQGASYEQLEEKHILGTFAIPQQGIHTLDWSVEANKAMVRSVTFELRGNVSDLNSSLLLLSGGLFLLGVIVVVSGLKRKRKHG